MAGQAGRSGRTTRTQLDKRPTEEAPDLDGTPEAADRLLQWASRAVARGEMDPRTGDFFTNAARASQANVRLKHGLHEMDELRDLVERQERAIERLTNAEQKARYESAPSAESAVSFGRVRVSNPEGSDPH